MNKLVEYKGTFDAQVKWGGCADPRGVLEEGESYEVERDEVHRWHTKIFLTDFPGLGFPSGAFDSDPA